MTPGMAEIEVHALTPERWPDLVRLFGNRGACGGCWCMWWRLKRSQFEKQKGAANKRAFKKIVDSGEKPGLLAYLRDEPIAWCSIAPRENFSALDRSRILAKVDERPVWSVVCLFVAKPYRRKGVMTKLLEAAAEYARDQGATVMEGYPVEPKKTLLPDAFVWTGLASSFRKTGFVEVVRRSETRPIMRRFLKGN